MVSIFSELLESCIEVFMDDFKVYSHSFGACLECLSRVLDRLTRPKLILLLLFLTPHLCGKFVLSLDNASFYKKFIHNFSKIALPLSNLLQQDIEFVFDQPTSWQAFPYYSLCILHIRFGQANYTTTKKELLAIAFALDKFHSYLLGSKIVVFSNHATLKFLLKMPNVKPRLICWMLLFKEFDIEIKDKSLQRT
ncbi:Retrovirus-related Pol polyprotein from transposon 17.6, partial [Mucuna pruriens]